MSPATAANIRPRKTRRGTSYDTKVYDPHQGRTRHLGTFRTQREALLAQSQFRVDLALKDDRESGDVTVAQFESDWLETHTGTRIASSDKTCRGSIKSFVAEFGDCLLRDLNRRDCKRWATDQSENAVSVARTMLNEAIDDELLELNPLRNLKRKKSRGRKDLKMISSAQLEAIEDLCLEVLSTDVGPQVVGVIRTSAYLGLRKCEAFACSEDWFDASAGEVLVKAQMGQDRALRAPKTGKKRRIALTPQMIETIRRCGPHKGPGPLFRLPSGKSFTSSSFYYYWKQVAAASGIEKFQFHELRHFHATWLRYQGVPTYAIAVQLGHGQPEAQYDFELRQDLEQTRDYIHDSDLSRDIIREKLAVREIPVPNTGRSDV